MPDYKWDIHALKKLRREGNKSQRITHAVEDYMHAPHMGYSYHANNNNVTVSGLYKRINNK